MSTHTVTGSGNTGMNYEMGGTRASRLKRSGECLIARLK